MSNNSNDKSLNSTFYIVPVKWNVPCPQKDLRQWNKSRCSSAAVAVWCHCSVDKNQNCTNWEYKCSGVCFLILSRSALKCGGGSGRNKPGIFFPSFMFVPCQIIWYDPSEISGKLKANCPISTVLHQTVSYIRLWSQLKPLPFFPPNHVTFWHPHWLMKLKWYYINPSKLLK